jgi:hypothetical protein
LGDVYTFLGHGPSALKRLVRMEDIPSSSLLYGIEAVCSVGAPANGTLCMTLDLNGMRFGCVSGCKGYGCDIMIPGRVEPPIQVHVSLKSLIELRQHLARDRRVSINLRDDASRLHICQTGEGSCTDIEVPTVDADGGAPELPACVTDQVCLKPERLRSALQRLGCVDKSTVRFSSGPDGRVLASKNVDGTGGSVQLDAPLDGMCWTLSVRLDRHRLSLFRWCARASVLSFGVCDTCVEFRAVSKCGMRARVAFCGLEPEDATDGAES